MKKKTTTHDDDHEAHDDGEDHAAEAADSEEEEERPVAKPAKRARPKAERAVAAPKAERAAAKVEHDDHGHDDHDHDDHDDVDDEEDPYWWTPHAVMIGLVVMGVLGFFGLFNKAAASILGKPQPMAAAQPVSAPPPSPVHQPPPQPPRPPMPGLNQNPGNHEMFGAKHLLVQYKGSMRAGPTIERSKEEAKTRAEEAMKKAKDGGKFEQIVAEYSDEPGAGARGGDLGKFPRGRMDATFQAAVEKLKVGEVSPLVETPFGYHVILRTQ